MSHAMIAMITSNSIRNDYWLSVKTLIKIRLEVNDDCDDCANFLKILAGISLDYDNPQVFPIFLFEPL